MIKHLATYQHKITEIVDRAENLIGGRERPSPLTLGKTRWALARALNEYQVFKHSRIFDPILAQEHGPRAELARSQREACMALGAEYRTYVAHWNAVDILDRWEDYRSAALAMLARIRGHVQDETAAFARLDAMPEERKAA